MYRGELFNSISHLVGGVLALIGTTSLLTVAALQGDGRKAIAFAVYGTMLILLYVMSTLYHAFRGPVKDIFRKLDHLSVYLLIAGTYTPFALVSLRHSSSGMILLATVWTLALIGIVHDVFFHKGRRILPAIVALLMGWLVIFVFGPLSREITMTGMLWIFAGGVFYSVGTIFFALSKKWRHGHAVWHVFVMLGSLAHFVVIYAFVALR